MKKIIRLLLTILVLPALLSACIVVPWDDGYYHGGYHHDGYRDHGGYRDYGGRGGGYDGRR